MPGMTSGGMPLSKTFLWIFCMHSGSLLDWLLAFSSNTSYKELYLKLRFHKEVNIG